MSEMIHRFGRSDINVLETSLDAETHAFLHLWQDPALCGSLKCSGINDCVDHDGIRTPYIAMKGENANHLAITAKRLGEFRSPNSTLASQSDISEMIHRFGRGDINVLETSFDAETHAVLHLWQDPALCGSLKCSRINDCVDHDGIRTPYIAMKGENANHLAITAGQRSRL